MIHLDRVSQLIGHCGPASISMMLSFFGEKVDQRELAAQAGVSDTIEKSGSRLDQLSFAISELLPSYLLLGNFFTSEEDINFVLNELKIPLGVEWQGIFFNEVRGRFEIGHYSVLNDYSPQSGDLGIIDPDDESVHCDGIIPKETFFPRWWEINVMNDGKKYKTEKCSFVVIPKAMQNQFEGAGFEPITHQFIMNFSTPTIQ